MKYTEKSDKKQDAKTTKGLDKDQKKKFEAMDKKHKKPKSQEEDTKMDKKIVKKIKKKQSLGPRKGAFCFIIEGIPCGNQCFTRASKYAY